MPPTQQSTSTNLPDINDIGSFLNFSPNLNELERLAHDVPVDMFDGMRLDPAGSAPVTDAHQLQPQLLPLEHLQHPLEQPHEDRPLVEIEDMALNVENDFDAITYGAEKRLAEEIEVVNLFPARLLPEPDPLGVLGLPVAAWKTKCKRWNSEHGVLAKSMKKKLSIYRRKVLGRGYAHQKRQRKTITIEIMARKIKSLEAQLEATLRSLAVARSKLATRKQTF
jgi:hypothetical protein